VGSRNPAPPHRSNRLPTLFLALLVTTPFVTIAAGVASSEPLRRSQPARFSDLAELTPANVGGLLPLVPRDDAAKFDDHRLPSQQHSPPRPLQVDSLASAGLRLQRFLDERVNLQLAAREPTYPARVGASGCEISCVFDTLPAAEPSAGAPGERQLRAWDPLERRVVWSVTEALPVSARTLITAGGLVFFGTTDGWLKALDARTGRTLWKHRAEGRELDEPFSYRATDGHQYIGVRSRPRAPGDGRETLLIFALAH
jgi:PQQ-like domain